MLELSMVMMNNDNDTDNDNEYDNDNNNNVNKRFLKTYLTSVSMLFTKTKISNTCERR